MVQKVYGIVLIGAGVLLVVGLLIVRRDLEDTSRFGKRIRRLIQIGLLALTCFGVAVPLPGCDPYGASDRLGLIEAGEKGSVTKTRTWRQFMRVWEEASSIADGEKGSWPYSADEKRQLIRGLEKGLKDTDYFVQKEMMSQPEGELLKLTVNEMIEDAGRFRTVEMKRTTCYMPGMIMPGRQSAERLSARIQYLKKLAMAERVQGVVLEIVLSNMEDEIAELEKQGDRPIGGLDSEQTAASILAETRSAIDRIRTQFKLRDPEQTDEQQTP